MSEGEKTRNSLGGLDGVEIPESTFSLVNRPDNEQGMRTGQTPVKAELNRWCLRFLATIPIHIGGHRWRS